MVKEATLREIIEGDLDLFELKRPPYAFKRTYSVGQIHDSHWKVIELPKNALRTDILYWEVRETGYLGCLKSTSFMEYDNRLVPLCTHTSDRKSDFQVYELDNCGNEIGRQPFYEFVLERLPEKVILTRVLSKKEVNSWANCGELGSKHYLFWKQPTVHTAYHSITSEFRASDKYSQEILMYVDKELIEAHVEKGDMDIATNSFLFSDRREDSQFPFDMEFTFREGGFQTIREGYNRWRSESKVDSIENPFYSQATSK